MLIVQLPNLLNFFSPWGAQQRVDRSKQWAEELAKLDRAAQSQEFDRGEHVRRQQEVIQKHQLAEQADREGVGADGSAREYGLACRLAAAGRHVRGRGPRHAVDSGAVGNDADRNSQSLARTARRSDCIRGSQRTGKAGRRRARGRIAGDHAEAGRAAARSTSSGLSEPVSAIALGGFRSLVRSPEAKMMLLSPVIMIPIFGSMLLKGGRSIPESIRPLVAIGGMVFVLLGVLQLMGNQFGFDRDGFRVFVLSPASRRDILLGKNTRKPSRSNPN